MNRSHFFGAIAVAALSPVLAGSCGDDPGADVSDDERCAALGSDVGLDDPSALGARGREMLAMGIKSWTVKVILDGKETDLTLTTSRTGDRFRHLPAAVLEEPGTDRA